MSDQSSPTNFIRQLVTADLDAGRYPQGITTRFPPEPNGYLHIGHAKSICLNFGLAEDFGGRCALRFDDTNPDRESPEFVEAIKADVQWLGFDWKERLYHASDYFEQLYAFAVELIDSGNAYVCDLSADEIRGTRGTLTTPGVNSPFRDRSCDENRELFEKMRWGEFPEGSRVLRARINMASPNLHLRDPTLYRIRYQTHHNTGDNWCIYPMYDFTHPLSDAIEGVTHSLCTLEFEDNRALYDWVLEHVTIPSRPYQTEFSRLSLEYTMVSKRLLTILVEQGVVGNWDDPRMPTLSGMRRRGYPPEALVDFCTRIGVTRNQQNVELSVLDNCVREALDPGTPRAFAVIRPLKIVIENYPEDKEEALQALNHPGDESLGTRSLPFCRELYIEQEDFQEDPPKKFFRLAPGREVRLRYAYLVTCTEVIKDSSGEIIEVRCTYDPETRGGNAPDGRKVKGTIHWVSAQHSAQAEVRLYEPLFVDPEPNVSSENDLQNALNETSLTTLDNVQVEPSLTDAPPGSIFQFERLGYFCVDRDSTDARKVFNRTVALRDSWAKAKPK
ncbi:MAG TPA: glutamine--tRNA ligase [Gammaproteobacteria bacterium]|jgi:glutaminyl-tRNA synthetase|nr:MAG: glutamine--tRNA ligase/YqeY domain fusion protein [Proteobacteria bacterium TMED51]HAU40541.1 glutamine--tRNA ligase [Gammaproteobacteria bacterium]HBP84758.1 glutamine--tRNA ligase [Gammaproteobacteria bacterium]|tara:strand:+ start:9248 stop:10924 length:1677 start_codon:yes stop_codon:yes gene_type:complete